MSRPSAFSTARRPHPGSAVTLACALALGASLVAGSVAAATYKWVDEQGVVHYTDKIPPEAVNRGTVEINKDGVPVRKVDPALTPEQRKAREQDDERRRALTRQQEDAARRDRALLASYANEAEIDLARDRSLKTIDAVVQSAIAYSEQLAKRKADIDQRIAAYKGKQVPAVFEREAETLTTELSRQAELISAKRSERAAVAAKYEADKVRYRDLAARLAAETGGTRTKMVSSTPAPASASTAPPAAARK